MSARFIKFIPSEKSLWLMQNHPNAFLLLCLIANRARRTKNHIDGLEVGDALIGDYKEAGIETEMKYRTAKNILCKLNFIKIKLTSRNRKNATTGITINGTLVTLLNSDIWDINLECDNDRDNERITTEQRPDNDEQERIRKNKNVKNEEKRNKKESSLATELLTEFFESLTLSLPNFNPTKLKKTKAQLSAMDRLIKAHGIDKTRLTFKYAHEDKFWKAYVHSAIYLEKKFETLSVQIGNQENLNGKTTEKHSVNVIEMPSAIPRFKGQRVLSIKGDS